MTESLEHARYRCLERVEYSWGRMGDDLFDRVMSKSEVEASSGKPSLNDRTVSMMLKDAAYTIDSKDAIRRSHVAGRVSTGETNVFTIGGMTLTAGVYLKNLKVTSLLMVRYVGAQHLSLIKAILQPPLNIPRSMIMEPKLKVQKLYPT